MHDVSLNLIDKLVLIALDDEKGSFSADSLTFEYGLAGALMYELTIQEKIKVVKEKVLLNSVRYTKDDALNYAVEKIQNSKKERPMKYWVEYFGNRASHLRKPILQKLISKGILEKKEQKFLWVFPNNKYPTKNDKPENTIKARLKAIISRQTEANADDIMLISLIDSCKLNKQAYGKELSKEQKKVVKGIISESNLANETHELLKEIHDIIVASLVVIFASSTITTTS